MSAVRGVDLHVSSGTDGVIELALGFTAALQSTGPSEV